MNAFLNALNLLILLAAILGAVMIAGKDPGTFHLVWLGWEAQSTAAVAMVGLLIISTAFFYFGQFFSWLRRLPALVRGWFRPAPPKPELATLLHALSLHAVGDTKTAAKLVEAANPRPDEELLEDFARLRLNLADPIEAQDLTAHPVLGPLAALARAKQEASNNNWATVRDVTKAALDRFGKLPHLQTLHLKALLNLGETSAANQFLPHLRSNVPTTLWPLLDIAVKGPTTTTAAGLGHPWFNSFQLWLASPQAPLPPLEESRGKAPAKIR
jgi:hypothetical protein